MHLHSTIFILKLSPNNIQIFSPPFTFYNIYIKTTSPIFILPCSKLFTFYNIYIKTSCSLLSAFVTSSFTFYNIYIKTCSHYYTPILSIHLHSTIFILKLQLLPHHLQIPLHHLHSTIFILKRKYPQWLTVIFRKFTFYNIYIKTALHLPQHLPLFIFTFYNIYIKTLPIYKKHLKKWHLHSTIFILKLRLIQ